MPIKTHVQSHLLLVLAHPPSFLVLDRFSCGFLEDFSWSTLTDLCGTKTSPGPSSSMLPAQELSTLWRAPMAQALLRLQQCWRGRKPLPRVSSVCGHGLRSYNEFWTASAFFLEEVRRKLSESAFYAFMPFRFQLMLIHVRALQADSDLIVFQSFHLKSRA